MASDSSERRPSPQPSPRGRGSQSARLVALLLSAFGLHPSSFAQTTQPTISATLGFDGVFKPDSYAPVFVKVADPASRPGVLELRSARGRVGNVITARVQSNPKPTTFTLYAPLDPLDRLTLDWRDEAGRLVSHLDLSEQARQNPAALGGPVFGVAGQSADADRVAKSIVRDTAEYVAAGAVSTRLLPERAVGLNSVDVLVLPNLQTDELDDDAERQILDWVRAGGIVITWLERPSIGSPLEEAMHLDVGDIVSRKVDDREVAMRNLLPRDAAPIDRSDSRTVLFLSKQGLGHIAVFGFDPTMGYRTIDDRVAALRKAMDGQIPLSPNERRAGVFDPLTYQARGVEKLTPADAATSHWPWIALLFGIILGPGEALLLLLCRRPIATPVTVAGAAVTLAAGVSLLAMQTNDDRRGIEVILETDDGVVARSMLRTWPVESQALWAMGSSGAPLTEFAGELSLNQRRSSIEPAGALLSLSGKQPRVRSLEIKEEKPLLLVRGSIADGSAQVQSADESGWGKSVWLSPRGISTLSRSPVGAEAITINSQAGTAADADDPATARRETAIEAQARQLGWEPILMDRHLASHLVALFEAESTSAIIAQRDVENATQYVIHMQRR